MGKYEEAMERAKAGKPMDEVFPELKESEDERIRKALLRCCDDWEKGQFGCMKSEDVPAIRTYLEKQKEQNTLSTEETELNSIAFLEQLGYTCVPPGAEQKPAEWSEEDEKMLRLCENRIMGTGTFVPTGAGLYDMVSWLKSLRQQPHWKPSEE